MMSEGEQNVGLLKRTKDLALRVIRLYSALPQGTVSQVIGKQVLRSGTSVGAHYSEGSRARSRAEFISKIEVAIQELEETKYWFDLLVESGIVTDHEMSKLRVEPNELTAILVASVKTAKKNRK